MEKKKKGYILEEPDKKTDAKLWTMAYTTEENLPPIERLIWDLKATREMVGRHRSILFWLLLISLAAHAIR